MDFAKRAYDHSFPFDPIVRSLLDTDFYKLLMLQFIWKRYRDTHVTFAVTNRTKKVRLANELGAYSGDETMADIRQQLDHVKSLRWESNELVWLAGQTFYGQTGIFEPDFIEFLRVDFALSDYTLEIERDPSIPTGGWTDPPTGQLILTFAGSWLSTTMWEIYALEILNELRYRKKMQKMKRSELDIMFARAKVKLYAKLEKLKQLPDLNLTDFGTRRRFSHLWQEHAILTAKEVLGGKFTGTSNCYFAMKHGLDAKGTNAHELPMVLAALAEDDHELKQAQYKVLKQWQELYKGNLLVFLPDTFGTTQFLEDAPSWLQQWVGARPDSKEPIAAGEELLSCWSGASRSAPDKLCIFADGLDVKIDGHDLNGSDICEIYDTFNGRMKLGFGFGTNFTCDFIGCHPGDAEEMKSISLVCKVQSANDCPAVKLSDNPSKATGPADEVARYLRIFGTKGTTAAEVKV